MCNDTKAESELRMLDTTRLDELRRISDEIQLKVHLAGMDARDYWRELQPRLAEAEHRLASNASAANAVSHEPSGLGVVLRHLGEDVVLRLHGDYMRGW